MVVRTIILSKSDESARALYDFTMRRGGVTLCARPMDTSVEMWSRCFPRECFAEPITETTKFIFIVKDFADKLSGDALEAVVAHEHGHDVLKHPDGWAEAGLPVDFEKEYEADAYAAKITSPAALIEGLERSKAFVMEVMLPYMVPDDELPPDEILQLMHESLDVAFGSRIERLRAMMN